MDKYIIAGVGVARMYDQNNNLIVTSKTLTDAGLNISVTAEDIRGGMSNPLLGRYFHDSNMSISMTDALFSLRYLALNVGGSISHSGGTKIATESQVAVTSGSNVQVTVTGTPAIFGSGTIGWVTKAGEDNWQKVTFSGSTATIPNGESGATYCVEYYTQDYAVTSFEVPAEIIPSEVHLVITYPLFKAGSTSYVESSRVGDIIVDVPRFQLDASVDFALSASGATSMPLSGMALASGNSAACDASNIFGTIKQVISGANWYDGLINITRDGGLAISGSAQDVKPFDIVGVWSDGTTASIDLTLLTITTDSHGTVNTTNKTITLTSSGDVEVQVTNKTSIACTVTLTVA